MKTLILKSWVVGGTFAATIFMNPANAGHVHPVENNVSPCVLINSSLLGNQECAKTMTSVFDTQGRLWSVWSNDEFLYVNYSDDKGKTFSNGVKVNTIAEKVSARHEHRPKIKISKNGNIYLSWTVKLKKRFTGNIRFSKSIDNGKTFSQPITVNDNRDIISHRFDTLGVNKNGDIYISWLDKRDKQKAELNSEKYNGAAAYFAVSVNEGISFSQNYKLADNSCECCRMTMDFDQRDFPVIAWRHIYGDNIRDHSIVNFKNRLEPNAPTRLSKDNWKIDGCPHHGPSLSISDENIYHAVWFNDAKHKHGIFYANSHDSGKSFSESLAIGQYNNNASHADIATLDQSVYIVWQEFNKPTHQLYIMVSNNNGRNWSKPQLLSSTIKMPDYPFVIIDKKQVYVSWYIPGEQYKLLSIRL